MTSLDTFGGYRTPGYRSTANNFPTPTTGDPLPLAWFWQTAFNQQEMWNSFSILNSLTDSSLSGRDEYVPTIEGATFTAPNTWHRFCFLRIGQMCTVWGAQVVTAYDAAGVTISVPVPAARSVVPSMAGAGYVFQNSDCSEMMVRLNDQVFQFVHTDPTGNDGLVGDVEPLDPADPSETVFAFTARYRCIEPPDGRLNDRVAQARAG